ncbi:uncharacterized protein [Dermacentor andersoni]|uniref:uncharacterized protein isoform X1 n=2 Tax=Dermacentor andersoni TaxID=34620 RepID=UPI00241696F5|nr:uncharacterized protein LOC126525047 isoform X1 [Dermacentor andersoni]
MDSIPAFVPEGATKKSAPRVVSFAGQDIEKTMTPEATQDVMATAPMFATPTSDPAHLTSGELQRLRLLHDDALQGRTSSLSVALIIACISSIALALIKITIKRHDNISSAECVFFVGTGILVSVMPTQSDTLQPFGPASAQKRLGVSAVLTTLAYILGYMAVQFMSVVEATVVAAITPMTTWFTMVAVRRRPCHWVLVPVLASCVTAIVLVVKPPIFGFKNRLHREMVIGGSCGVVSTLLVGVENAFKVNMPGVTRIVVLFHLSCVMMVVSFVAGSLAGTFNIIRSGPEVSELLFVVYLSYVSHISLARQVRREHTWVILLVRIVANIVCAMVLESAFVDPDLLDSAQVLAALMVVFAGALTTLHLLVEGQENSPVVAAHRFLQLFT